MGRCLWDDARDVGAGGGGVTAMALWQTICCSQHYTCCPIRVAIARWVIHGLMLRSTGSCGCPAGMVAGAVGQPLPLGWHVNVNVNVNNLLAMSI